MHTNYLKKILSLLCYKACFIACLSLIGCASPNKTIINTNFKENTLNNTHQTLEYLTYERIMEIYNQEELYSEGTFEDAPIYKLEDIINSQHIYLNHSNLIYKGDVYSNANELFNTELTIWNNASSLESLLADFPTNLVRTIVPSNEITSNNEKYLYIGYRLDNGCRLVLYCNKFSLEHHTFAFTPLIYSHLHSDQDYIDLITQGTTNSALLEFDPYLEMIKLANSSDNYSGLILTYQGLAEINISLRGRTCHLSRGTYGYVEFHSLLYKTDMSYNYYGTYDLVPIDW